MVRISMPTLPRSSLLGMLPLSCLTLLGASGSAQAPPPLQVDRADYVARCIEGKGNACSYRFTLIARYENRTADTLYISRCGPRDRTPEYGVEAINDTTEDAAYSPAWGCYGHDSPIVVAPHVARVDTLQIQGPNAFDGKTNEPMGKFEGEFRLLYRVGACWPGRTKCRLLPEWERSATFRVHLVR